VDWDEVKPVDAEGLMDPIARKLRDLAEYKGRTMAFRQQLNEVREQYRRRSALMRRLREAGLI